MIARPHVNVLFGRKWIFLSVAIAMAAPFGAMDEPGGRAAL